MIAYMSNLIYRKPYTKTETASTKTQKDIHEQVNVIVNVGFKGKTIFYAVFVLFWISVQCLILSYSKQSYFKNDFKLSTKYRLEFSITDLHRCSNDHHFPSVKNRVDKGHLHENNQIGFC